MFKQDHAFAIEQHPAEIGVFLLSLSLPVRPRPRPLFHIATLLSHKHPVKTVHVVQIHFHLSITQLEHIPSVMEVNTAHLMLWRVPFLSESLKEHLFLTAAPAILSKCAAKSRRRKVRNSVPFKFPST
jgi:hypothetical protein